MLRKVIQYRYQAHSQEEALQVVEALRPLETCLDARAFGWAVAAHFEIKQEIAADALPEGCYIVPLSVLEFIQRTRGTQS